MEYKSCWNYFSRKFRTYKGVRGVGVELEIPIVDQSGEAVGLDQDQDVFRYLQNEGFELELDCYTNQIVSAKKYNARSAVNFDACFDKITTDVGYSILEIASSPQLNIYEVEENLNSLIRLLLIYFDVAGFLMIGMGTSPVSSPSKRMLMPKERYYFLAKFSANNVIPFFKGSDSDLLTVAASNQCHLSVCEEEAVGSVNVFNALSGLFLAVNTNSPLWEGAVHNEYKAIREMLWDDSFDDQGKQTGIPSPFKSLKHYFDTIISIRPHLVCRNGRYFQIVDKPSFLEYIKSDYSIGKNIESELMEIVPELKDIDDQVTFTWYNARLVAKYGTVECRVCCEQPQEDMMAPTALALGVLENLSEAKQLVSRFKMEDWKGLRYSAAKHGINAEMNGRSIETLIRELLEIADTGLKSRRNNEEKFLQTYFARLEKKVTPADQVVELFENKGLNGVMNYFSFNRNKMS